jgi:choline dehydrogenase-like flavoprotein
VRATAGSDGCRRPAISASNSTRGADLAQNTDFDVVVVGSGAAGGMAAFELTMGGLTVLMLEAGRDYDPHTETPMFQTPQNAPLRGQATADKSSGFFDATVGGGSDVPDEPYSVAKDSEFVWWRPRMLGGRTNHWGRVSLRLGPYDFKSYSRDGLGFDWPISYEELAPWYDSVERLIGVTGLPHGIENTPDSPPGVHLKPPPPRVYEIFLSRAFASMGIKVAAIRAAILTQPHNGRPACVYATDCMRGCSIRANFQSTTVLIPPASGTGRLTIQTDALVYKVNVDKADRATGVEYIDRRTGDCCTINSKAVVLAAGSCATARILFNSNTARFPKGLTNGSGFLGKFLMDSTGTAVRAHIPALEKIPSQNEDGIHEAHIYVPWWGYRQQELRQLDFPRGYQIEMQGGWRMPDMKVGLYINYAEGGETLFGSALRDAAQQKYGSLVVLGGGGEMIPNENSYCELDPVTVDRWKIPTLRFNWKWSDHEINQVKHMHKTFQEVIDRLNGKIVWKGPMLKGGEMIHEVGGVRMGSSSSNSCVNSYGQSWDIKNLFVMDGGVFVTKSHKNPTLTILALASRNARYLLGRAKKNEL